jgi:hypothetical protein
MKIRKKLKLQKTKIYVMLPLNALITMVVKIKRTLVLKEYAVMIQ